MKRIELEVTDETYDQINRLAAIVSHLVKDNDTSLTAEDIVYASLAFYLRRFYPNLIIEQDTIKLYSLSIDAPLKNNLDVLFGELNMSLGSISKQVNLPKTTVSNILHNKNQPTMDVFLKIYPLLGFPPLNKIFYRELDK